MNRPKLIVIDDEADLAGLVCDVAQKNGFEAQKYTDAVIFQNEYNACADVIILDLMMPGIDGIEVIRFLAEHHCDAQLVLMSGFDMGVLHSAQKLATEQHLNFAGSLSKPFRMKQLGEFLSGLSITPKDRCFNVDIETPALEELQQALLNNELLVYYQPKVELNHTSMPAVEALVRWQHPQRGLIAPDLFIPLAEQHGLIDQLTWIVLEQAMSQCRTWKQQGLNVQVAINMSANTLKELDLPEKMGRLIEKYGLQPSQIVLEITESALMQELIRSLDILTRLRMKGVKLSIDDFGTGYSSLLQLHRAPFSEIKIDKSFVSDMEFDSEAATIVETIIMLGHKLKMKAVAEGVETQSCQQRLTELKCDQAQGYLFSRPVPGEEIPAWFKQYSDT